MNSLVAAITIVISLSGLANAQSETPRKFKHGGKIVTTYDKAKNLTTVLLRSYTLKTGPGGPDDRVNSIELTAGFTYPGRDPIGEPKVVEFVLDVSRSRPRSKDDLLSDLTAEIEDQRISLGTPQLLSSGNEHIKDEVPGLGTIRINSKIERMGVLIPVDVFKKLAAARVVQLQSGDMRITLREKQLDALRDLGTRIK